MVDPDSLMNARPHGNVVEPGANVDKWDAMMNDIISRYSEFSYTGDDPKTL